MAHAQQHHQRERLREALLLAGITEEKSDKSPFVVGNVKTGEPYIVAFCDTPGFARVHGLRAVDDVDPSAYADSLVGMPELPPASGTYSAVGLVQVTRPTGVGKPTLMIDILRYVPQDEAEGAYRALLDEHASPDESTTQSVDEESREPEAALAGS